MLVVFAGGGTGGHIYPGAAVAHAIAELDSGVEAEFWGSGRPLETEILRKEGFNYRALPSAPLPKSPLDVPRFVWSLFAGRRMARRLIESSGAAAVVGLGGFSSYAPVKAAVGLGVPVFLLEQNAAPGVANVRLARRATLVCLAWETSATRLPAGTRFEVTGNPLRRDLVEAAARTAYNPGGGILILGGSTGAVGLNTLVTGAAKALGGLGRPIVHQTGAQDFERVREAYRAAGVEATVSQYIDDMAGAYAKAAVVIARAGGTTLSELALFGLPVVLIPYPYHKDNHQMLNARIFTEAGAGEIIEEKKNTSADLARVVAGLEGDSGRLERMHAAARRIARPEAAETVASRIWAAIEGAQATAQETR